MYVLVTSDNIIINVLMIANKTILLSKSLLLNFSETIHLLKCMYKSFYVMHVIIPYADVVILSVLTLIA